MAYYTSWATDTSSGGSPDNWGSVTYKALVDYGDYATGGIISGPITVELDYDDTLTKEDDMKLSIGGGSNQDICHLCGAEVIQEEYSKTKIKKTDEDGAEYQVWSFDRTRTFECGTTVHQIDDDRPEVKVGKDCIKFVDV